MIEIINIKDIEDIYIYKYMEELYNTNKDILDNNIVINVNNIFKLFKNSIGNVLFCNKEDKIIGCFLGKAGYSWFRPDTKVFRELQFYILPDYRGGTNAYRLYKQTEEELKGEFDVISIGGGTYSDDTLDKFLSRLGYNKTTMYSKTI